MPTMQEMQDNMTIFYYKSNGDIYSASSGIQELSTFFVGHAADIAMMVDEVILPNDNYVLTNPNLFVMDLSGSSPVLSLKQESINQYPVIA